MREVGPLNGADSMPEKNNSSTPKGQIDTKLSPLSQAMYRQLDALLQQPKSPQNLNAILRLMAKWRSEMMSKTVIKKEGLIVRAGPFKGMKYGQFGSEGAVAARLLGTYEFSLHAIIEEICTRDYAQVMDLGCAEGYYAVGLACRLPRAKVFAYDSDPGAQQKCAQLAKLNNVQAQVCINGPASHRDFDICTDAKTLVFCDIEGAEAELLDPQLAVGLKAADILVEAHDCFVSGLSHSLAKRFGATHEVQIINRQVDCLSLPDWMHDFSDLDRLIALWEWRRGPTPWLWMKTKTAFR